VSIINNPENKRIDQSLKWAAYELRRPNRYESERKHFFYSSASHIPIKLGETVPLNSRAE
jgi:hypothetical protein